MRNAVHRSMTAGICVSILAMLPVQTRSNSLTAEPDARLGMSLYNSACATCHGLSGDGKGPGARYLTPRPRDFTSGAFKFRSTLDGELPTDEDLIRTVTLGIARTTMPAWGSLLGESQIRDVVSYIKMFNEDFADFGPGDTVTIPPEPDADWNTVEEGRSLYMIMQCWTCHGTAGKGDGYTANQLTDDSGQPIRPFDFTTGVYKSGKESWAIYKALYTGLNGTPMPSYASSMIFGSIADQTLAIIAEEYSTLEVSNLSYYLDSQPAAEDVAAMSDTERDTLSSRRMWSIVHYVQSLSAPPSALEQWFAQDTETTP